MNNWCSLSCESKVTRVTEELGRQNGFQLGRNARRRNSPGSWPQKSGAGKKRRQAAALGRQSVTQFKVNGT
jgi:hypothetical protein